VSACGAREQEVFKPFCYYCDRVFDDEKVLIEHQKARHFKCTQCSRKLTNARSLVVHLSKVHKEIITKVPNAMEGRDSLDIPIEGVHGIPEGDQTLAAACWLVFGGIALCRRRASIVTRVHCGAESYEQHSADGRSLTAADFAGDGAGLDGAPPAKLARVEISASVLQHAASTSGAFPPPYPLPYLAPSGPPPMYGGARPPPMYGAPPPYGYPAPCVGPPDGIRDPRTTPQPNNSPQRKEAQPTSHALASDSFNIWTPRLLVWSGGGS
jgi:hypothetical protein